MKLVERLTQRVAELEAKKAAQAEKIAIVEKEQKNAPAADALWSTITKRSGKKSPEQLKVINVMADESKERYKKEKNVIIFGLKESAKESITDKKSDDAQEIIKILEVLSL